MDPRLRSIVILRAVVGTIVGIGVGITTTVFLGVAAGLLAGWTAFAAIVSIWVVAGIWRMDGAETRRHASAEDPGRSAARLVSLIGSSASLGAVAIVLIETANRPEHEKYLLALIAVLSVVFSWGLIQIDYTLRVARMYYGDDPEGGIDFNQKADPDYADFLYFSLGVGMGYQVADTNVGSNAIRRMVIAQALIAYVFGAVIVGTVVNLVLDLG